MDLNHYPRHIGDWLRDTAHLSEIEECIYSRCVDQYYSREKPLPLDLGQCARLVRAASAAARKALATILPEFFTQDADGWHQKRCDEEISHYHERSESAKHSVQVRWNKRNTNVDTNVLRTYSERNTNQNQEPVTIKTNTAASPPARSPSSSRRKPQTPVPEDFAVSEGVQKWATANNIGRLQAHLEHFKFTCAAKGYVYSDHDAAFKKAIRGDWAKLGATAAGPKLTVLPELPRRDGDIPDAAKALIAKMRAHG